MTSDRVLRSNKRCRVEDMVVDALALKPSKTEEAPACKTQGGNAFLEDVNAKEMDKNCRPSPILGFTEGCLKQTKSNSTRTVQNSENENTNAASLRAIHISPDGASSRLSPGQHHKLATTLPSWKGKDTPDYKPKLVSTNFKKWHFVVSEDRTCNMDAGEPRNRETEKIEELVNARCGTMRVGWKARVTNGGKSCRKSYYSGDGRRLRSKKEVARHPGCLSDIAEEPECTEVDSSRAYNPSAHYNAIKSQLGLKPSSIVDSNSKGTLEAMMVTDKSYKVSPPAVKPIPETGEPLIQTGRGISGRSITGKMESSVALDKTKVPFSYQRKRRLKKLAWVIILEKIANIPNVPAYVIKNQMKMALEMDPPEWVKQKLQPLITAKPFDNDCPRSMKDVISGVLERINEGFEEEMQSKHMTFEASLENAVSFKETEVTAKRRAENAFVQMDDTSESCANSEATMDACRTVWQDVILSQKFEYLSNFIYGNIGLSNPHEVVDFELISLRMKAGTYGVLPRLFVSDMQEIWDRVKSIGEQMIELAAELSELFHCSCMKKDNLEKKKGTFMRKT